MYITVQVPENRCNLTIVWTICANTAWKKLAWAPSRPITDYRSVNKNLSTIYLFGSIPHWQQTPRSHYNQQVSKLTYQLRCHIITWPPHIPTDLIITVHSTGTAQTVVISRRFRYVVIRSRRTRVLCIRGSPSITVISRWTWVASVVSSTWDTRE